jgi:hypothetical protein
MSGPSALSLVSGLSCQVVGRTFLAVQGPKYRPRSRSCCGPGLATERIWHGADNRHQHRRPRQEKQDRQQHRQRRGQQDCGLTELRARTDCLLLARTIRRVGVVVVRRRKKHEVAGGIMTPLGIDMVRHARAAGARLPLRPSGFQQHGCGTFAKYLPILRLRVRLAG